MTFLLPRYFVIVLDHWTTPRNFYLRFNAERFARKYPGYAFVFQRRGQVWVEA